MLFTYNLSNIHPDRRRYYLTDKKDFPVIVWFHGGGLEGGEKDISNELKEKGVGVVVVNYRLSPKAGNPAYIKDAAESVAWIFRNIATYGGSVKDIYVSGHSAGCYLVLDWIKKYSK